MAVDGGWKGAVKAREGSGDEWKRETGGVVWVKKIQLVYTDWPHNRNHAPSVDPITSHRMNGPGTPRWSLLWQRSGDITAGLFAQKHVMLNRQRVAEIPHARACRLHQVRAPSISVV